VFISSFLIEEEDDGQEQNEDSGQLSVQQREKNNFIEQSLNLDDFYEIKDRLFSKSRELWYIESEYLSVMIIIACVHF
jgi:hypothetical protein